MKTYVCGHRNPDTDSIMSAYALADLRRRTGMADVEAICAGRLPDKAKWVFDHFGVPPVRAKRDVYVRVRHLIDHNVPMIDADMSLVDALRKLEASGESSLPVRTKDGSFLGMLSPAKLLNLFLSRGDLTIPVSRAPLHRCSQVLNESDPVHDIRLAAVKNAHNHFPVVEVVAHHRIAFTTTKEPIRYTSDVVGSTCTLVARMFRAAGECPTRETAGILMAGIISDTLLFQSPTTTDDDRSLCTWLEKLCGETAEELMEGMLTIASPLTSMSPDQAIASDAKTYTEGGHKFVLAQIEETHMSFFHKHQPALTESIDRALKANGLDFFALMVTDPVRGNSELLYRGLESVRRALPYRKGEHGTLLMPGVLSRKKQLLPEVLAALS